MLKLGKTRPAACLVTCYLQLEFEQTVAAVLSLSVFISMQDPNTSIINSFVITVTSKTLTSLCKFLGSVQSGWMGL